MSALSIDESQQGDNSQEIASTLHTLAEMLRGSVSACQETQERRVLALRVLALRGIQYSRQCLAIRRNQVLRTPSDSSRAAAGGPGGSLPHCAPRTPPEKSLLACANALHLLGYHCAEYARGPTATQLSEQASIALQRARKISEGEGDEELAETSMQDLGLCFYYQKRYQKARLLYTSADVTRPCHRGATCVMSSSSVILI